MNLWKSVCALDAINLFKSAFLLKVPLVFVWGKYFTESNCALFFVLFS